MTGKICNRRNNRPSDQMNGLDGRFSLPYSGITFNEPRRERIARQDGCLDGPTKTE